MGGISVAPEEMRITGQKVIFPGILKTVKQGSISFFTFGHQVVHLAKIGKFGIFDAPELAFPFGMQNLQDDNVFPEGAAPDPCNHLLLDPVLVESEGNKTANGVNQEEDQDGDDSKLFQAFISG